MVEMILKRCTKKYFKYGPGNCKSLLTDIVHPGHREEVTTPNGYACRDQKIDAKMINDFQYIFYLWFLKTVSTK